MLIPIRTEYRLSRPPVVNYLLLAANILIYVLGYNGNHILRIDAYLLHPDAPHLYQFITSVFLHGSLVHLLGNMVFLWVFGNAINDKLGNVGYLGFYLAGGVLSNIGYLLLAGEAPVLGASGAISAVTGAYLVLFPRVQVTLLVFFYFITTFEVSSLVFLLFQFVWNLWMSMGTFGGPGGGGVAYAAHSTGYVFGIVIAAGLLLSRTVPRDVFDLLNLFRSAHRRRQYRRMVAEGFSPIRTRDAGEELRRRGHMAPAPAARTELLEREQHLRQQVSDACARGSLSEAARHYLELVQLADEIVLSRQNQLDVANQLMAEEQHAAAADAYERFLKYYGNYEHIADINLILGLLYGRYLHQDDRAADLLTRALEDLHDPRKEELARRGLMEIQERQ